MTGTEKSLLILLILAALFKGIVWAALIPIWHSPDEQAHFAQVQYYAENKTGLRGGNDLSHEVYESERLLGTLRDERGNNAFTYHPEFRIDYSDTPVGISEGQIRSLGKETRTEYVKKEAARYPPLYYILAAVGYTAGYPFDLFVRVSMTRMISVLMGAATVWVSYLLARSIFPKNALLSLTVASLVSFQPMFTFVTAGVTNDNLLNLLSMTLLWLMADSLRKGMSGGRILAMIVTLGLGVLTKQLIYPFIPLPILVVAHDLVRKQKPGNRVRVLMVLGIIMVIGAAAMVRLLQSGLLPWPMPDPRSPMHTMSLGMYLSQKLPVLYRETLPWYWGVFKWLGIVLPLPVLRAIKIVSAAAVIGLARHLIRRIRQKRFSITDVQLMLLIVSSIWFIIWLLLWDYELVRSIGFSHGLQGRYFFPNLGAHMTLIAFGLWQLTERFRRQIAKLAIAGSMVLNLIALRTMLASYYDLSPLGLFLDQASQYKPWFFKSGGLILWVVVSFTVCLNFLHRIIANDKKIR